MKPLTAGVHKVQLTNAYTYMSRKKYPFAAVEMVILESNDAPILTDTSWVINLNNRRGKNRLAGFIHSLKLESFFPHSYRRYFPTYSKRNTELSELSGAIAIVSCQPVINDYDFFYDVHWFPEGELE